MRRIKITLESTSDGLIEWNIRAVPDEPPRIGTEEFIQAISMFESMQKTFTEELKKRLPVKKSIKRNCDRYSILKNSFKK
jgi:hypothetical protein